MDAAVINHNSWEITAPAKLNLVLKIGPLLESGFHQLSSLICPIDLVDHLRIVPAEQRDEIAIIFGSQLERHIQLLGEVANTSLEDLQSEKNLAMRALAFLRRACPEQLDGLYFRIELTKQIPFAAGLGGGSADAAAVLLALNAGLKLDLDAEQLDVLGLELGADVPAMLRRALVHVRGVGEIVTELTSEYFRPLQYALSDLGVVLIKPPVSVHTAAAYAAYDRSNLASSSVKPRATLPDDDAAAAVLDELLLQLTTRDQAGSSEDRFEALIASFFNDFQPTILAEGEPQLRMAERSLMDHGAHRALLVGSGSTVCGFFSAVSMADEAAVTIGSALPDGWFIKSVRLTPNVGADVKQ